MEKAAEQIYCEWGRDKKALNMTSIFTELFLVSKKRNDSAMAEQALQRVVTFAQEEWGKETEVELFDNQVKIENYDRNLQAIFTLNNDQIVCLKNDI